MKNDVKMRLCRNMRKYIIDVAKINYTGNLQRHIQVRSVDSNVVCFSIRPRIYDYYRFLRTNELVFNKGNKYYSSQLDIEGSPKDRYKGYIKYMIRYGIEKTYTSQYLKKRKEDLEKVVFK